MNTKILFDQTLRGFRARKGRSLLTMLGIIIGVAGVIMIISLGAGAQALVLGQVSKLGSNIVAVLPGKSNETGPPASVFGVQVTTLSERDVEALKNRSRAPNVIAVAPFVSGQETVSAPRTSIDTSFTGTTGDVVRVQNIPIAQGRFFTEEESKAGANVAVLGSFVAEELFADTPALGQIIKIKQVPFRVIGVLEEQGTVGFQNQDDQVYIPFVIAQRQLLGIAHVQSIRLRIDQTENVKQSIADIETILREEHRILNPGEGDDFSVRDLADAIRLLTTITDGLRLFLAVMASIALLVGGIGIMNIMLVTVTERTREIGLRIALGATRRAIRTQFLFEAAFLSLLGGILGIIVGAILSYGVALGARFAGYDWAFIISPVAVLSAVGVSIAVGIGFGLYPATKAAKQNPIESLRHE